MFQKISKLLRERATDRRYLRDVSSAKELQRIWEHSGVALFPEELHGHLRTHVRVLRVHKEEIVIAANDPHTKNALTLQRIALQELFEQETKMTYQAIRLVFRP